MKPSQSAESLLYCIDYIFDICSNSELITYAIDELRSFSEECPGARQYADKILYYSCKDFRNHIEEFEFIGNCAYLEKFIKRYLNGEIDKYGDLIEPDKYDR